MNFEQAWLNYKRKENRSAINEFQYISCSYQDEIIKSAIAELKNAIDSMAGTDLKVLDSNACDIESNQEGVSSGKSICYKKKDDVAAEGYRIIEDNGNITIEASDSNGLLYGTFEFIRLLQLDKPLQGLSVSKSPTMPLRMLNHWDNMDGSIERGYSGESFFFKNNEIITDSRTVTYARLLASVGINAAVINNVNVKDNATLLITDRYLGKLNELSRIFSSYGIKLFISLNYAAVVELSPLDSADPLSQEVRDWWKAQIKHVYEAVPKLGGFLIKADSEGRPGPFTYGRNHADGANMLAEAAEPYGGLIIWRCFVYNCRQDWRDKKTDRARSGYDNFKQLDGKFRDNVILQIKNGPMDFQVREPVHPLFGGLTATNQILEVQIAQEYTGQQRHVCYLIPMFKEILKFHTYVTEKDDTVADIVSGKTFNQKRCGMAAVSNTGNDENWTGHDLAAANLYGFGRLSFEPELTAEQIASEWIITTYGNDETVLKELLFILMNSWPAYEKYNAPLGVGWMVNPHNHYGPNVDGYEYDRWGTYHRADHYGIGVDRSENGTGYSMQYREPNASMYDNPKTCPEELLLFFHHIPYNRFLKSGKTVLQHIYDTHFEGVEMVDEMAEHFEKLEGKLPDKAYQRTKARLEHQREHSREWRDQINSYFYRKTGIPDSKNRTIY